MRQSIQGRVSFALKSLSSLASVAVLSLPSAFLISSAPVSAQEHQGCFMYDGFGRMIDLSSICPSPQAPPQSNASATEVPAAPQLTPEQQTQGMDAAATLYADSYCEARARGQTHRQASESAAEVASGYMVDNGLTIDLPPDWYETASGRSQVLCPELQPTGRYCKIAQSSAGDSH